MFSSPRPTRGLLNLPPATELGAYSMVTALYVGNYRRPDRRIFPWYRADREGPLVIYNAPASAYASVAAVERKRRQLAQPLPGDPATTTTNYNGNAQSSCSVRRPHFGLITGF